MAPPRRCVCCSIVTSPATIRVVVVTSALKKKTITIQITPPEIAHKFTHAVTATNSVLFWCVGVFRFARPSFYFEFGPQIMSDSCNIWNRVVIGRQRRNDALRWACVRQNFGK